MNLISNTIDQILELYHSRNVASNFLYDLTPAHILDEFDEYENLENNLDFLLNKCGYYIETFKYNNQNKALLVNPESKDQIILPYFVAMFIPRKETKLNDVLMYSLQWGWNESDNNDDNNLEMMVIMNQSKNINWMNSGLEYCSDMYTNPLKQSIDDAHTYCMWIMQKMNKFGYYKTENIKNIDEIVPNSEHIEFLIFDNPIVK